MKQILTSNKLIIKIGSSLIFDGSINKIREDWLKSLADDILLAKQGYFKLKKKYFSEQRTC